jgi:hypothetical protein
MFKYEYSATANDIGKNFTEVHDMNPETRVNKHVTFLETMLHICCKLQ